MDLRAAIAGVTGTIARLTTLVERYGAPTVKAVMRSMIEGGEKLMRERLQSIPDGRWSHRAFTEAALPGDRGVYAYQVNVTKADGRLTVDNVGTDPQAGSINVTYAAFAGAVQAATVSQLVGELAGAYGGAHRVIEIRPEPGLLSCADHPAAVSPSGAFTTEMLLNCTAIAIGKMLSCASDPAIAARGPLPPGGIIVDAGGGWVFRHEPSRDPARMQMFHQREIVRLGAPDDVLAWRDTWSQRGLQFLARPRDDGLATPPAGGLRRWASP